MWKKGAFDGSEDVYFFLYCIKIQYNFVYSSTKIRSNESKSRATRELFSTNTLLILCADKLYFKFWMTRFSQTQIQTMQSNYI